MQHLCRPPLLRACHWLLALVLLPALAQAQAPCATAYTTGGTLTGQPSAIRFQQSFTATCTGRLTSLVVTYPSGADDIRSSGYYIVVSIKDATGATTLATLPQTDNVFPGGTFTYDFSSANVVLTSGTQYRWEMLERDAGGNSTFPLYLLYSYTGGYAGGQQYLDGTGDATRDLQGWTINEAATVQTGTVASPQCAGSAVAVPFTAYGTIGSGNIYTAQLSSASGSFTSPTTIGTLSSTASSGTLSATVPAGTASGTGYRIRVVASTAGFTAVPNASDLTVNPTPAAPTGAASQSFSSGATVSNLAATGSNVQWYAASTGGTALASSTPLTNGTTYYGTQIVSGCESTSRLAVTATVAGPLPVELTEFTAARQGEAARLSWATASEKNSAYFEVQTCSDGTTFRPLGQVAAAGSSLTRRNYSYTDAGLFGYGAPQVYYRLRQVDQDGTAAYSPVRVVARGSGLTLFPNPAGHTATLSGATAGAAVQVYDALGSLVLITEADATGTAALVLPACRVGFIWCAVGLGRRYA